MTLSSEEYIDAALRLEQAALAADSEWIGQLGLTGYYSEEVFINTKGWSKATQELLSRLCICSCEGQNQIKTGHRFRCVFDWDELKPGELARKPRGRVPLGWYGPLW